MAEEGTRPGSSLDPTPRTMEQMLLVTKAMRDEFTVTFQGYDKAIKLLQDFADKAPTTSDVAGQLSGLRELMFEKFASVKSQFDQADKALTAALNAAEKAVKEQNTSNTTAIDKSEKGFKELLLALGSRVDATEKATDGKISDMKDRVTAIEQRNNGMAIQRADAKETTRDTFSIVFGVAGAVIGAASIIIAFIISRP